MTGIPTAILLSLLDVVRNVKPDILIGVSGQTGLFTEEIIREIHKHCPRPIVMRCLTRLHAWYRRTLSPGLKVTRWSPLAVRLAVVWKDKNLPYRPINNAFIFPGIGLGVIASRRVTYHR